MFSKKKARICSVIILGIVFGCLAYLHHFNTKFVYQSLTNSDSTVHYRQIVGMADTIRAHNPYGFFGFNVNYGFPYFLANFIVAIPCLLAKNLDGVVYSIRLLASLCMCLTLFFTYLIAKKELPTASAFLLTSILCLMPFFWIISGWFRADAMMLLCLSIGVWQLQKDEGHLSKHFWRSVLWFSITVAIKTQALILFSIPCFYLLFVIFRQSSGKATLLTKESLKIGSILAITFAVLNPYVLHPSGFYAIFRRLGMELNFFVLDKSSALEKFSFFDKLSYLNQFFIPYWIVVGIACLTLYRLIKNPSPFFYSLFLNVIVQFYYFYFLSKVFPWKFLIPSGFLLIILCLSWLSSLTEKVQKIILLSGVFVILFLNSSSLYLALTHPSTSVQVKREEKWLIHTLPLYIRPDFSALLMSPSIVFDYTKLHLAYSQVELIHGPLSSFHLSESSFKKRFHFIDLKKYPVKTFKKKSIVAIRTSDIFTLNCAKEVLTSHQYSFATRNYDISIFILKNRNPIE